jgi:hypothetical protein
VGDTMVRLATIEGLAVGCLTPPLSRNQENEQSWEKAKISRMVEQFEIFGFLTVKTRATKPTAIPVFTSDSLEEALLELGVPAAVLKIANERYDWSFETLLPDIASGLILEMERSPAGFEPNSPAMQRILGLGILSLFEAFITALLLTMPWIQPNSTCHYSLGAREN